MLLGHSWFYAMTIVVLFIFCVLFFSHEGKIIIIDQLEYCMTVTKLTTASTMVPFFGDNPLAYDNVVGGLFNIS